MGGTIAPGWTWPMMLGMSLFWILLLVLMVVLILWLIEQIRS